MDKNNFFIGLMGSFYQMGIEPVKFDDVAHIIYIIIPEDGYMYHEGTNIDSPSKLANRLKEVIREISGCSDFKVKYKVKSGYLTKEDGEANFLKNKDLINSDRTLVTLVMS